MTGEGLSVFSSLMAEKVGGSRSSVTRFQGVEMKLLLIITPLLFVSIIAFYSFRMSPQKAWTLETSARLWLIHSVLITATPLILMILVYRRGMHEYYAFYSGQFNLLVSNYGLFPGLLYIIPWLVYYLLFFLPPASTMFFSLFPTYFIRKHDKLTLSDKSGDLTFKYRRSISFFRESLGAVVSRVNLPAKPGFYIREAQSRDCYVFGNSPNKFSLAVTTEFLNLMEQNAFTLEELRAIISHEIAHVINEDLRLASSVKIFSDVNAMRYLILSILITLAVISLTTLIIIFGWAANLAPTQRMNLVVNYLVKLPGAITPLLTFLIICISLDLLIKTSFKKREFFADAQALQISPDESVYERALKKYAYLLNSLMPGSHNHLSSFFDGIKQLLRRGIRFVANFLPVEMLEGMERFMTGIKSFFSSHPGLDERIEAIRKRTYFSEQSSFFHWQGYFMVGLALLIPFLLFSYVTISLNMPTSWAIFILCFGYGCVCVSFIIINNARLRYLNRIDLQHLKKNFLSLGFKGENPNLNYAGRRLFHANILGQLPLAAVPLFLLIFGIVREIDFVAIFFPVLIMVQLLIFHFLTYFFLAILCRFKGNLYET
jgi:Zn-dependent protease with chaperone function